MFAIRRVVAEDVPFLWDMMWEATAVDAGMRALGREAAFAIPAARKYLEGWGRRGDAGVIAVSEDGRRLGATWYRLFPADDAGYGFVASDIPELSIGVRASERGKGIGQALLAALLALARDEGYGAVSLSVDRQNPARRLYERAGFREAGVSPETDTSVTMIAMLEGD